MRRRLAPAACGRVAGDAQRARTAGAPGDSEVARRIDSTVSKSAGGSRLPLRGHRVVWPVLTGICRSNFGGVPDHSHLEPGLGFSGRNAGSSERFDAGCVRKCRPAPFLGPIGSQSLSPSRAWNRVRNSPEPDTQALQTGCIRRVFDSPPRELVKGKGRARDSGLAPTD